jgi:uncharacterized Zn finger protein
MTRRYSDWDSNGWYRPAPPRQVRGGIRARSKHGAFASQWWGRRWISVLEGFSIGARLARGRSYARRGQVADLTIDPGVIRASVQGTQSKPYAVEIHLKVLKPTQWKILLNALREKPILAATLLAGEMPQALEELFNQSHLALFPIRHDDLATACSCPDWSNPCKHIAAVYYLLAETFDRDPFLLLKLRGMGREELFSQLEPTVGEEASAPEAAPMPEPGPLPTDPARFWKSAEAPSAVPEIVQPSPVAAVAISRLGPFPFWRGRVDFMDGMGRLYRQAGAAAAAVLSGERGEEK